MKSLALPNYKTGSKTSLKVLLILFLKQNQLLAMRISSLPMKALMWVRGLDFGNNCSISASSKWPLFNLRKIRLGNRVIVSHHALIGIPALAVDPLIAIGDDTWIGGNNVILCHDTIVIGKGCLFSENVFIADAEHVLGIGVCPTASGIKFAGRVYIGDNCFIGRNVAILPGTVLGNNCVVGANAVVKGEWPDGSVIGGVPAKLLKTL